MAQQTGREKVNPKDKEHLKDYEGGYGGGRQRIEQLHEHAFGEGERSTQASNEPATHATSDVPMPDSVRETHGPDWQEKFAKENSDKYGQWGGHPIEQRGAPQSTGGVPEEEELGDTRDVSPRGAYGIRETENWPDSPRDKERAGQVRHDQK